MEAILVLVLIIAAVLMVYRFVHMFTSNIVKANDDFFQQAGVRVDFKEGKIKINGKTYDVNQVTGITTVSQSGGEGMGAALRSTVGIVEIAVDDFKKPVHRITISGGHGKAKNFSQRLYTALRKAGGPDFH